MGITWDRGKRKMVCHRGREWGRKREGRKTERDGRRARETEGDRKMATEMGKRERKNGWKKTKER